MPTASAFYALGETRYRHAFAATVASISFATMKRSDCSMMSSAQFQQVQDHSDRAIST